MRGTDLGFVINDNGARLGDIKRGFASACRDAGLQDVSPHTLRHTCQVFTHETDAFDGPCGKFTRAADRMSIAPKQFANGCTRANLGQHSIAFRSQHFPALVRVTNIQLTA